MLSVAFASQRVLGWASTNDTSPLYGQDVVQVFRNIIKAIEQKPLHKSECEDSKAHCRPEVTAQDIVSGMELWSEYPSATTFLGVAECLSELQKRNASCIPTDNWTKASAEAAAPGGATWVCGYNAVRDAYRMLTLRKTQMSIGCQDWLPESMSINAKSSQIEPCLRHEELLQPAQPSSLQTHTNYCFSNV